MKQIKLEITALSPLAMASQKSGSVSEAEDYIPGSVIRGAMASQILRIYGITEENLAPDGGDFQALFLNDEPAIFHNAYPAVPKSTDDVMVLPATAVSSKTSPGFKPKGNGVFDTLIDRFCADAYNYVFDPSDPKSLAEKTDTRVEPFGGFYSFHNGEYRSHSVSQRFLTRVGINRQRATSEDGILYSIEVLNEFVKSGEDKNWQPVVYSSVILVEDGKLAESLTHFINENPRIFRLGGGSSRGLGKVHTQATIADATTDVKSPIKAFNEKLKSRWELWSVFGEPQKNLLENRTYFTLDLQADAILSENWQRTTVISPSMLCEFVNLEDEFAQLLNDTAKEDFLKLEVAYSSYNYRSGWNSAWGLMKDIELVTNRGAVYLFSTNKPDIWIDKLNKLELKGVGDRTAEGFGQVQICNEFHNVFRKEAV
ncbi:CRISPR-associated RAMP protein Csx10 [Chrysosporum ovalisporum CS-1034]|uniref:type III-D CRISPR-associated RAMP protein Csx10 n=1 Tax=Umezakia ovalisporum TaxID=75695 RepID=UPI0024755AED|nr:CRISPR-associated RAMP protein Csx10 [Umezakia ovalisporum]MDH6074119.1 CRISPR-associated RAMP protein Csx10 [Umezakia ovalisporum CS-1034]